MKIAYLCPFNDGTGYANAGIRTMLAMDAVGLDVYPIEIKMASQTIPAPERLQMLALKKCEKPDVIIQHSLPPIFQYFGGAKNIAFFHSETSNFIRSGWQHYLNLMDEVWVSCKQNADACKASQVQKPVHTIPLSYDFDSFEESTEILPLPKPDAYTFYSISDWSERKNVKAVITSYLSEFTSYDNVRLILKCYIDGHSTQDSERILKEQIKEIKQQLRLNHYPPIYLITKYLSDDEINALHNTGDCCVFAEKGAAWNLVAFDALVYGNALIINSWGGQTDFIEKLSPEGIDLVPSNREIVTNMNHCPYGGLYTGTESWYNPSTQSLRECMRFRYSIGKRKYNRKEGMRQYFGLEAVGQQIKDILYGNK